MSAARSPAEDVAVFTGGGWGFSFAIAFNRASTSAKLSSLFDSTTAGAGAGAGGGGGRGATGRLGFDISGGGNSGSEKLGGGPRHLHGL